MTKRFIDLSHPLDASTPPWPGTPPVEVTTISTIPAERGPLFRRARGEPVACNTSGFFTGNHTGTHMDAPAHFYNEVRTIDQVPLEWCIGSAVLVDARHVLSRAEITVAELSPREAAIKSTGKVLFWTGWSTRWGLEGYFRDYPVLSEPAATWLVERGVHLVGFDTPSPDRDPHAVHYILLAANLVIVENLTNLELIGDEAFELIVVPLALRGLEASPVRALAALTARHPLVTRSIDWPSSNRIANVP